MDGWRSRQEGTVRSSAWSSCFIQVKELLPVPPLLDPKPSACLTPNLYLLSRKDCIFADKCETHFFAYSPTPAHNHHHY